MDEEFDIFEFLCECEDEDTSKLLTVMPRWNLEANEKRRREALLLEALCYTQGATTAFLL